MKALQTDTVIEVKKHFILACMCNPKDCRYLFDSVHYLQIQQNQQKLLITLSLKISWCEVLCEEAALRTGDTLFAVLFSDKMKR